MERPRGDRGLITTSVTDLERHDRSFRFMRSAFPWVEAPDEASLLSAAHQIHVTVSVGAADASLLSGQFLVLSLANLLLRFPFRLTMRLVDAPLMARMPPYDGQSLREALERLASALGVPIDFGVPALGSVGVSLSVETPESRATLSLSADGWIARLALGTSVGVADDPNPVGPFASACAGAAETVRAWARTAVHLGFGKPTQRFHADAAPTADATINLWRPGTNERGPRIGGERIAMPPIDWCGAGAVGQNALAVLGGVPLLQLDGRVFDPKDLDEPDLNRSLLSFQADIESAKADVVVRALRGHSLEAVIGGYPDALVTAAHPWVVCSADDVEVRPRCQALWPERLIVGATELMFSRISWHSPRREWLCAGCRGTQSPTERPIPTIGPTSAIAGVVVAATLLRLTIEAPPPCIDVLTMRLDSPLALDETHPRVTLGCAVCQAG